MKCTCFENVSASKYVMKNIDFYLNVCNTFQSQINANIHITPFHDIFLKHFSESSDIFINKSHTVYEFKNF